MAETLPDIGATAGWIVDQGEGEEAMNAAIRRRGFGSDIGWLP